MPTPAPDAPAPRFFSWEEANRTLPLVRRVVADLVAAHEELRPLMARFNALPAAERTGDAAAGLRDELSARAADVEALADELHALGCHFKGFEEGLVDWYSYYAGRPVFLCWKAGEGAIEWWHQIDAGFMGRQPIAPEQRDEFRSTAD